MSIGETIKYSAGTVPGTVFGRIAERFKEMQTLFPKEEERQGNYTAQATRARRITFELVRGARAQWKFRSNA